MVFLFHLQVQFKNMCVYWAIRAEFVLALTNCTAHSHQERCVNYKIYETQGFNGSKLIP